MSRARKRKLATAPRWMTEYGGAMADSESMAEARDRIVAIIKARRPGWRWDKALLRSHDGAEVDRILTEAGHPPGQSEPADGLRHFISSTPGAMLVGVTIKGWPQ